MRLIAQRVFLAFLVGVVSVACADRRRPDDVRLPKWTVDPEPLVRIGGSDQRFDYLVYRIFGLTRLSDGRIAVASQGASQIKFFAATGEHVRSVGQEGRGPGEYRAINAMLRLPGDTLLVLSTAPGLTWLSPEGDYLGSVSEPIRGRERHPCRISDNRWHHLNDGSLVSGFEDSPGIRGCPAAPTGTHRGSILLERQDYASGRFDTLAVMPGTERTGRWPRVFGASLLVGAGGNVFYAADAAGGEILALTPEGSIERRLPWPFPADEVPESAKGQEERVVTWSNGAKEVERYDYPSHFPRGARFLVDQDENLWVMRYPRFKEPRYSSDLDSPYIYRVEAEGAEWRVLNPTGEVIAEVHTPGGFFLWEIGVDYVLGTVKDEYDVEEVRLYRLERGGQ